MSFLWEKVIRPAMFGLNAETAHELGMKFLMTGAAGWFGTGSREVGSIHIERFGMHFANPLGMAAGFDKNAVAVDRLAEIGFGFVEVGTVTFRPQPGNPKPRLFRLPMDEALINRLGFNNDGAAAVFKRLSAVKHRCVVGVNIGKNKDIPNEEAAENYLAAFEIIHPAADYITVNISSPNTPALRELQRPEHLEELLKVLQTRNKELGTKPLLVKIAPDLTTEEIEASVDICLRQAVAGIVATNTTTSRNGLKTPDAERYGQGGLSGRPLRDLSTKAVETVYRYSKGKIPIIGVGGIFGAEDAFEKITAGASLLQAYSGFVYKGPGFARMIVEGLKKILDERGFSSLDEAVGSGCR